MYGQAFRMFGDIRWSVGGPVAAVSGEQAAVLSGQQSPDVRQILDQQRSKCPRIGYIAAEIVC